MELFPDSSKVEMCAFALEVPNVILEAKNTGRPIVSTYEITFIAFTRTENSSS
jgi:hypothetical protein